LRPRFIAGASLGSMIALAMLLASCGYGVGGRASRLPPGIKVIAVPSLVNKTNRYRIEQRLTEALVRELLSRTKYRVVANPEAADAVLRGEIDAIEASSIVFDPTTGRTTTMLVTVTTRVRLEDRETHKVLYRNDKFVFRQPYETSTDIASFFQEEGPAMDRLAHDFASRLVADVLENF